MAIAIVAPTSVNVGQKIVVTGTGFTHGGNVKVNEALEEGGGLGATGVFAADGGGAFTTDGVFDVVPNAPGYVDVKVDDVTAGTTISARVEVFQEG